MRADGAARPQDVSERDATAARKMLPRADKERFGNFFFFAIENVYIGSFIKNANFPQARRRFPFPAKGAFAGY